MVVRNYAAEIFEAAGFSERASLEFTIVLGAVKVVVTAYAIYEVGDRFKLAMHSNTSCRLFRILIFIFSD